MNRHKIINSEKQTVLAIPWDDLRKFLYGGQHLARVQNGVKTLLKINRLSRVHERYGRKALKLSDKVLILPLMPHTEAQQEVRTTKNS